MKELGDWASSSSPSSCIFVFIHIFITFTFSNVEPTSGFSSLLRLPQSRPNITWPQSKRVLSVDNFGAKGDGFTDDSQALKMAWNIACSFPRKTTIVIPAGRTFLVHPIDLAGPCKSKVTLRISGTVNAPRDPNVWASLNPRKWLYFHGLNHFTVEGRGIINGMGHEWWARSCKTNSTNPCQHAPTAITFHRCKILKIRHLLVIDSQQMHMAFTNCQRVVVSNLKLIAPSFSPNTDGIHISTSNGVRVEKSIISTGDDCVSIVGNSSRILIKNIVCAPGHGISIGSLGKSNSRSQVSEVTVDGVILSNTENGVRIKTWQGGSGFATAITFKNVSMENVSNPIIIDQYYCDSQLPCTNQTSAVKVANISFMHIKGTSATEEAIRFACSDVSPCQGLYLEDIQLVSYYGVNSRSFCWEANGSSVGLVYPRPCFLGTESFIQQKVISGSAAHSF